jgi:predicted glycosyltransferase
MSKQPRLLFYCQHVMGMGDLVRSLALAKALTDRFRVVLLNGGLMPSGMELPEELEVINLPPLGFDDGRFVSRAGEDVERAKNDRQKLILKTFQSLRPEVLLVELFPFGRKKFEFELLHLLEDHENRSRSVRWSRVAYATSWLVGATIRKGMKSA